MAQLFPITAFEFSRVIKKKWFIIGTILTPLLIGFYALFPAIMKGALAKQRKLVVYDQTGVVFQRFVQLVKERPEVEKVNIKLVVEKVSSVEEGKALVGQKKVDGFLLIPADIFEKKEATLYLKNIADMVIRSVSSQVLARCVNEKLLKEAGLPPDKLRELVKGVKLNTLRLEKGREKKGGFETVFLPYMLFSMLILFGLVGYGNILLRRVLEDKTSRVVEILYSSATPYQIFAGKLLGVGLAGMFQMGIWILIAAAGFFYLLTYVPTVDLSPVVSNFLLFLLFFFSGFFLYSSLFLAVGAITRSEEEAQHLLSPIMFMITIPFGLSFMLIQVPESLITKFFSFFPYTAPFFMLLRCLVARPSLVEIAISVVLVFSTAALSTWVSAKIFRIGMLAAGKPASVREVLQWIREKE